MHAIEIQTGTPLSGSARVPGSKSIAQRWLLAAACAQGRTRIRALPAGEDVAAASRLIAAAGAKVRALAPAALAIDGLPPGPHRGWHAEAELELGESGTLARLATAIGGLCGRSGSSLGFGARGSLRARRSPPLFASLRAAGVRIEHLGRADGWPLRLWPIGPPSSLELVHPISSQEWSALALALACWPDETELVCTGVLPSQPYARLTVRALREFGAHVSIEGERCRLRGPLRAPADPLCVEPDASAAAVALAAALASGGSIEVEGLAEDSCQGDLAILEHLRALGGECTRERRSLRAWGRVRRAVELDLSDTPDLAPVLAGLAAVHAWEGGEASRFTGLGTLPRKESSRIAVLVEGFAAAGLATRQGPDWLEVGPRRAASTELVSLDPHGDHRMAFAFALLGLARGQVRISGPDCVAKSWPGFFEELRRLGARLSTR